MPRDEVNPHWQAEAFAEEVARRGARPVRPSASGGLDAPEPVTLPWETPGVDRWGVLRFAYSGSTQYLAAGLTGEVIRFTVPQQLEGLLEQARVQFWIFQSFWDLEITVGGVPIIGNLARNSTPGNVPVFVQSIQAPLVLNARLQPGAQVVASITNTSAVTREVASVLVSLFGKFFPKGIY